MKKRDKRRRRTRQARKYQTKTDEWKAKTNAQLHNEVSFLQQKETSQFHVVGVMGFAGSWKNASHKGQALERWIAEMRATLSQVITAYKQEHKEQLVICSGATMLGVLQLTYDICAQENITTMGITPDRALLYDIAPMAYLVPVGRDFGDESDVFVRLCDEFLLLGGGKQSQKETIAAAGQGKKVTIIQGFGGVADTFSPAQLPRASFITTTHKPTPV